MHILMLNYEFPPLGGGAGNAAYYLLRELARCHSGLDPESRDCHVGSTLLAMTNQHQVRDDLRITFVTSSTGGYREEQFAPNIKIHYLDIGKKGKNPHYQTNKDLLSYAWAVYRFCKWLKKKEKIDLVHAFFGIPCGYIAMKLGLPYIVSLRGTDVPFYNERFYCLDKLVFKRLSGKIWQRAEKVIANSEGLKQLALKSYPKQKISVIPNGVDINMFQPLFSVSFPRRQESHFFTILSTSRLIQRKGLDYLIDAFVDFNRKYPNSRLVLAGSGNMETKLKKKAELLGISKKISFLGTVSKADIPYVYQQADVFVLPSLAEGMSNAVLEAMASGLAILSTDVGGTAELIGDNGLIIEKGSSRAIFEALERLYLDSELLSAMKLLSRQKAEQMSWANMAEQYRKVYWNICAE